jgi:REP element-mobilizing transposase RayT
MARTNRRDVLADGEIQVVHCINRCVRRAYLCGQDPLTGTDYEHRRELIRHRMEFLAGIMGIEVLGYAIMSNHFHCVLRSRHDVVATWSDEEVAQKWWMLCPARKDKDGNPAEPTEFELNSIRNDKTGLKEKRVRLSSISWFMRFLSERVAKEANKQDQCSGRFWEGRFKSQVLLDDAAILACLQYVDLNPVRAKIAVTPESSDFTSAQDRIADLKTAHEVSTSEAQDNRIEHGERAGWLAPIPLEPKRQAVRTKKTVRRASSKGCLTMGLGDYLQLLDWTGRQIRSDKRGAMPANLEPLFERLGISTELWVDCVVNFRKWFRSSVGRPKSMEASAEARGHNRALSVRAARRAFVSTEH